MTCANCDRPATMTVFNGSAHVPVCEPCAHAEARYIVAHYTAEEITANFSESGLPFDCDCCRAD